MFNKSQQYIKFFITFTFISAFFTSSTLHAGGWWKSSDKKSKNSDERRKILIVREGNSIKQVHKGETVNQDWWKSKKRQMLIESEETKKVAVSKKVKKTKKIFDGKALLKRLSSNDEFNIVYINEEELTWLQNEIKRSRNINVSREKLLTKLAFRNIHLAGKTHSKIAQNKKKASHRDNI